MSSIASSPSSLNFFFLNCYSPLLDRLGAQAERYFKEDIPPTLSCSTAGQKTWQDRRAQHYYPASAGAADAVKSGLESLQERNEVLAVTGLLASLRDRQRVTEFFRRRSMINLLQQTPLFQELTRAIVRQAEQRIRIHTLPLLKHNGLLPDELTAPGASRRKLR